MAINARKLSTIGYMTPVESISRKFALRKETAGDKLIAVGSGQGKLTSKFFGGSVRRYYRAGSGQVMTNVLFFKKYGRITAPSVEELQNRQNFSAASKWANAAAKDISAITHNQQIWDELVADPSLSCNGVYAAGYGERAYLFAYAMSVLATGGTLPANHQLPDPA